MNRRNMLWTALSSIGAALAASRAAAATGDRPKAVYHLCDLDKVSFVLGTIQNHFDGCGGPDKVTIALVIHGPALRAFNVALADPELTRNIGKFSRDGLELAACSFSMKVQNMTLKDLPPGFVIAEKGGVVRIAELQSQGYAYLRP
jgi:intracellular sulfur oxidation DsrE/DsrF family protein